MRLNYKINRRYRRSVKANIIFYIAASLLTMLSILSFALLYSCGTGIKDYVDEIFKNNIVEDADFQTLLAIEDSEISELESKHHILLEKQQYLDFLNVKTKDKNGDDSTSSNTHARVFKENLKINKYTITETSPNKNINKVSDLASDEIIINEKYAKNHNISLDSDKNRIILENKEYKVVGYFVRPDYLYALEQSTDTYGNYDTFLTAYINNESFNSYKDLNDGNIADVTTYAVKYNQNGETNVTELRQDLFKSYLVYQYDSITSSARLNILSTRPQLYISFSFLFLAILPIAVVLLIAIILNIKVKNDQKIIGTISALGYSDKEIAYHYSIMAMIPGIIGGLLMTIIIYISVQFFGKLSTSDFEVMRINFIYPWYAAILGFIVPTVIYVIASFITIKVLINKPVTSLLRGAGRESKSSKFLVKKKYRIIHKFPLRLLIINKGRALVVLLGVTISTLVITMSFMIFDTIDGIVTDAMKKAGDFEYEYTLKIPQVASDDELNSNCNYMLATIYESNYRKIPLMGANKDNMNLWYTKLVDGTSITELNDNTFYVSSLCAELMGVKAGDNITIKSNFNESELNFTVTGIIDNGLISYILTSKRNVLKSYISTIKDFINQPDTPEEIKNAVNELLDENNPDIQNSNLYNIVLSKEVLNDKYQASNVMNIFMKSSIEKQKDARLAERKPIIYLILIIGIMMCIVSVFTVVNVIIEDNQSNITMLKVLGYKEREINRMILSGNHLLVPIGIACGIPLSYLFLGIIFKITIPQNNMIMSTTLKIGSFFAIIGIIIATYLVTLFILKQKASRYKMTDSLKDNR